MKIKHIYKILFFLCLWTLTSCSSDIDTFLKNKENVSQIIAHQGNWQYEGLKRNSVEALKSALQWGFYGSECDIRMTIDSVFVIRHDDDFHGMKISSTKYQDLKGYILDDEYLFTLDEFLKALENSPLSPTKLILDLKHVDVERLLSEIESRGLENRIEFLSTKKHINSLVNAGYSQIIWCYDSNVTLQEAAELSLKGVAYNIEIVRFNENIISEIQSLGMEAGIWTVNDKEDIKHYVNLGYKVISDRPIQK